MSNLATHASRTSASTPHAKRHKRERFRPLRCVGKWQLCQLAGCGSFTDVFLAKPLGCPPNWPADYAVKILRSKARNDHDAIHLLRREAEVASQVSHRHLATVLEAHLAGQDRFLVMPKLEGVSVGQVIERVGFISVRQALWITRQVSEALHALHQKTWLHGDVKPENIMLSHTGHVTLIDLGFAIPFSEAILTEARAAKGTLHYVAPETMTSAYCSDQRSDIYSLGISLFRMLTGRVPFEGRSPGDLIDAHRSQPIPDPREFNRDIPGNVVRLLSRMTSKQPIRRPQSATDLIQSLLPLEVEAMKSERILRRVA